MTKILKHIHSSLLELKWKNIKKCNTTKTESISKRGQCINKQITDWPIDIRIWFPPGSQNAPIPNPLEIPRVVTSNKHRVSQGLDMFALIKYTIFFRAGLE